MKTTILAAAVIIGMGLAPSVTMAARASGVAIGQSAVEASPVTKVWCRRRQFCNGVAAGVAGSAGKSTRAGAQPDRAGQSRRLAHASKRREYGQRGSWSLNSPRL